MSAPRSNSAPETVAIPRIELATQAALLALADRALGLVMDAGPHGDLALLDLERAFVHARTAIRNEIASRQPGGLSISTTHRPRRSRKGGRPTRINDVNEWDEVLS